MKKNLLFSGILASIAFSVNAQVTNSTLTTWGVNTPATGTVAFNVFIGANSGQYYVGSNSTDDGRCTFVGQNAGRGDATLTATGDRNTFIGSSTGIAFTTGEDNTFVGASSGQDLKTGSRNTFVGRLSGYHITSGNSNTCLGTGAGLDNTSGVGNTFIGDLAGQNGTTGNYNVCLGYNAGKSISGSHKLYIANSQTTNPLIYGEFANDSNPALLKFNAKKVGIGYNSGGFGAFPTLSFANADSYRLFVRGGILATEVRVRLETDWADYVFNKDYKLLSLEETEKYITQNGHLPNMPSAAQVAEEGIEMGNMAKLQQEKIEELTLHVIELNKQLEALKAQNAELMELKVKVEQLLNQK